MGIVHYIENRFKEGIIVEDFYYEQKGKLIRKLVLSLLLAAVVLGGIGYKSVQNIKEDAKGPVELSTLEIDSPNGKFVKASFDTMSPSFALMVEEDKDGKEKPLTENYHLSFLNDKLIIIKVDGRVRLDGGQIIHISSENGYDGELTMLGRVAPIEDDISDILKKSLVDDLGFESPVSDETFSETVQPFMLDTVISDKLGTDHSADTISIILIVYVFISLVLIVLTVSKMRRLKKQAERNAA